MQHESQALTRKNMFRFGFTAALVGVAVGIGLLSQQLGHAAPSSLTPDAAMVFKKKDKVLVSVSLANYR
ncbi:MAG: hypothetical protein QF473_39820, partial [Planctomycetota bacterium]|nr:hypothetical protein [Planctomycetota bacterium]